MLLLAMLRAQLQVMQLQVQVPDLLQDILLNLSWLAAYGIARHQVALFPVPIEYS